MSWFKRHSKKQPEKVVVPNLRFLGGQDGFPERELKAKLKEFFERDQSVKAAYLAQVAYGDRSPINIVLCLQTQFGPDHGMAEKIGRIFSSLFGADEHMDIVFLTNSQEAELVKVCHPFFVAS
jgi:hypothetical protein